MGIDNGEVATLAPLSIVAGLEVVRGLSESELVKEVVVCVHRVKQLCDRCIVYTISAEYVHAQGRKSILEHLTKGFAELQ